MKFAHISDTHIRNLKYHYEYREVFEKIYEILQEQEVDYIIHCGDLAHTKTQLSPEYFEMATNFLRSLAEIAPTYIIPGNHDGNLKNSNRQDAITPIVDALEHPNLHLLKHSGEVQIDDEFVLNVLSVFDEENWRDPGNTDRINIALYHGSISGCETDLGWTMEHGENDISVFKKFDFAFLGDIHKTNQCLDHEGRIRYCGSTVQQNHGETNDKGFLIWDIKDKENFSVKHISVPNPKPFVTVELTTKGRIPKKTKVPKGARLRIASSSNVSLSILKKAIDVAKTRYKPESITFLNRAAGNRGSVEELTKSFMKEDLRDIGVQEKFMKEYLKDYNPADEVMEKVFEYNKKYNAIVEQEEEVFRNVNWKLVSLEWDNLFNYGEGNKINFENMNGIVGIFGKNYSGKSSVVDSLLYTLYNSTSKNNRKNLHVINQNKDSGKGKLTMEVNEKIYNIERISEKYERSLHGETTLEARTDVNFENTCNVSGDLESLNGLSRNDTDKNIRKVFGNIEDFLLTSMSSQVDSLSFIKEGSTRRKEILAKFIDLEIFDQKYKMAKEDASDLRGALKKLEEREFGDEILSAEATLMKNITATQEQKQACGGLKKRASKLQNQLLGLQNKIDQTPAELIDIEEVKEQLNSSEFQKKFVTDESEALNSSIKEKQDFLKKIEVFIKDFKIEDLKEKKELILENKNQLNDLLKEIEVEEDRKEVFNKKLSLLEEVPCGPEFSHCKFIRDAYAAKEEVSIIDQAIGRLREEEDDTKEKIESLNPEKTQEYIEKYEQVIGKQSKARNDVAEWRLKIEKNKSQLTTLQVEADMLKDKIVNYEKNKELIDNLEALLSKKTKIEKKMKANDEELQECDNSLLELYKFHGSYEQQLASLEEQKRELSQLREDYSAYDLFMKCVHPNGIPYDIIKKKLPLINEEIAKILTNIVNFEVFFDANDKKLEIFIKHPRFEPRPIELGSGAEKTISAMAIRLALLGVSNLPKPDLFILDEPGTALDEDNMEGFVRILTDMIKTQFKTVLLISHLDSLKDCVDTTIEIEKQDGLAYINQ